MSDNSSIEWTEATWNPTTGCTKVSPGCDHCYAETFAERWRGVPGHHFEQGFDVILRPDKLDLPLRWRKPRRIFVNSMSDLFHDAIPDEYIARVIAVMHQTPRHTYQVLTKRHARLRSLFTTKWADFSELIQGAIDGMYDDPDDQLLREAWPVRNIWWGVSVEDQKWADIRIPALLETPAAVRWLSCEPLLGPLDLMREGWLLSEINQFEHDPAVHLYRWMPQPGGLDWVVVGGESGPGARPMHPDWARGLRDQCTSASVPFFHKQNGQFSLVLDRPEAGDLWLARDGATSEWEPGDGYVRRGGEEFVWPGTRTVLVRRARSKHAAGREMDGREWNEYPQARQVSGV